MPKWGIEMSEGLLANWGVAEGEAFERGRVLALIETDKITNEIEAETPGRFARLIAREGDTLPVGALLAVLGEGGAAEIDAFVAGFRPADTSMAGVGAAPPSAVAPPPPPVPDTLAISPGARAAVIAAGIEPTALAGSGRGGRIERQDVDRALLPSSPPTLAGPFPLPPETAAFASPAARRLAREAGIELAGVAGSGRGGRIGKGDVAALLTAAAPPTPEPADAGSAAEDVPMSPMRKAIARRLTAAKATIPHFYVRRRVRADRLLAFRATAPGPRASINDYLVRACALALVEVPALNIQVHGDSVRRFAHADIAVAVATERGLITPILAAADRLTVSEISAQLGDLAARARAGRLAAHEFEGGSFTLSNLGPFGVEQFDAIINPPQGAILAVGAARPEPIADDGAIRIVPVLHLSLSCDHRAIDGADAGRFLAALAQLIENPARL